MTNHGNKTQRIVFVNVNDEATLVELRNFFKQLPAFEIRTDLFEENFALLIRVSDTPWNIVYGRKQLVTQALQRPQSSIDKLLENFNLQYKTVSNSFRQPSETQVSLFIPVDVCILLESKLKKHNVSTQGYFIDPSGVKFSLSSLPHVSLKLDTSMTVEDKIKLLEEENAQLRYELLVAAHSHENILEDPLEGTAYVNDILNDVIHRLTHALKIERNNHERARNALESLCKEIQNSGSNIS